MNQKNQNELPETKKKSYLNKTANGLGNILVDYRCKEIIKRKKEEIQQLDEREKYLRQAIDNAQATAFFYFWIVQSEPNLEIKLFFNLANGNMLKMNFRSSYTVFKLKVA